jgi:hypothetical protein
MPRRRVWWRSGGLPGADAAGREAQQVLDGVALSRPSASHPVDSGLTLLELRVTHLG